MNNTDTVTVNIPITFDAAEFWSAVMGGGWETWEWWYDVRYEEGADWETPGRVTVFYTNPDDPDADAFSKTITIDDLVEGLRIAIFNGYSGLGDTDWASLDYDADESDIIMQCAVLGDCIYS